MRLSFHPYQYFYNNIVANFVSLVYYLYQTIGSMPAPLARHNLVGIAQLEREIGIPVRTIRSLMQARRIPFLKLGRRTLYFDVEKVLDALDRFEVKAIDQ